MTYYLQTWILFVYCFSIVNDIVEQMFIDIKGSYFHIIIVQVLFDFMALNTNIHDVQRKSHPMKVIGMDAIFFNL